MVLRGGAKYIVRTVQSHVATPQEKKSISIGENIYYNYCTAVVVACCQDSLWNLQSY